MLRLRIRSFPLGLVLRRAALIYLAAWVLSPFLAYGLGWRILAFSSMGLWVLLELRAPRSVLLRPDLMILVMWGFFFYTLGIELIVPDAGEISRHFQLWIMFFFLLAGESARRRNDGELQFLFWAVLLILPTAVIGTLYGIENIAADVARTISRSSDEARELAATGIGGYGLVYAVVLILPFLTHLAWFGTPASKSSDRSRNVMIFQRLLVISNWLLCVYLVIRAGYSIALILTVISVLLVLMVRSRKVVMFGVSTALVVTLAFGAVVAAVPLMNGLLELTAGTEYYAKVRDIRSSFDSNEDVGTVAGRSERYERSVQLFVENPVLGTLRIDDVGKHSAVLDRFAQYGIVIGFVFFWLMGFKAWRAVRNPCVPIGLAFGFFVVAVGFPLVNNIFSAWGLMLYITSSGAFALIRVPLDRRIRPRFQSIERGNA